MGSMTGSAVIHIGHQRVAKVPTPWVVGRNAGSCKASVCLIGTTKGRRIPRVKGRVLIVISKKKALAPGKKVLGIMTIPIRISVTAGGVQSSLSSGLDHPKSSGSFLMEGDEFRGFNDEEIGEDFDWLEDGQTVVYLESWQMKKMVAAANLGAKFVNVEELAAELGLNTSDVLAWLQNDSSKTAILESTSEGLSYMEDVHIEEHSEKEAVYVPPPPLPLREVNMRKKVDNLMYKLKEIMPGLLADIDADEKKWKTALNLFCKTVELQNPLFCLRGRDALLEWMRLLGRVGVVVKLHDIYYQNTVENPYHRWVYGTFRATLTGNLLKSVVDLGLTDWWTTCHDQELVNSTGHRCDQRAAEKQTMINRVLELSGECRLEMDESGLVTNVNTKWYKLAEQGQDITDAKFWLSGLLRKSR